MHSLRNMRGSRIRRNEQDCPLQERSQFWQGQPPREDMRGRYRTGCSHILQSRLLIWPADNEQLIISPQRFADGLQLCGLQSFF